MQADAGRQDGYRRPAIKLRDSEPIGGALSDRHAARSPSSDGRPDRLRVVVLPSPARTRPQGRPGRGQAHAGLQRRLADVQAEQHSRTAITASGDEAGPLLAAHLCPAAGRRPPCPQRPGFMPSRQPTARPADAGIASAPQDRRSPMIGPNPPPRQVSHHPRPKAPPACQPPT